jgi:hypothetical protein
LNRNTRLAHDGLRELSKRRSWFILRRSGMARPKMGADWDSADREGTDRDGSGRTSSSCTFFAMASLCFNPSARRYRACPSNVRKSSSAEWRIRFAISSSTRSRRRSDLVRAISGSSISRGRA